MKSPHNFEGINPTPNCVIPGGICLGDTIVDMENCDLHREFHFALMAMKLKLQTLYLKHEIRLYLCKVFLDLVVKSTVVHF